MSRFSYPTNASTSIRTLWIVVVVFGIGGCSFNYDEGSVEAETDTGLPQVEIVSARMVVVRDNRLELYADRIASFPDEGVQRFHGVVFREYGPSDDLRFEGRADMALLYLDTEDIELTGNVRIVSYVEDGTVETEYLYWDNEGRLLYNENSGEVIVSREDGTRVEGSGLFVDGRRNTIEFREGVSGVYYTEDE